MTQHANIHAHKRVAWKNRWTFMLATAGSAIGLGNIWKLPYMIGVNGGSAFVLVFIACIFFVGIPLMMTEILLGRRAQKNPLDGMAQLAREAAASKHWRALGGMVCSLACSFWAFTASSVAGCLATFGLHCMTLLIASMVRVPKPILMRYSPRP